MSKHIFFLLPLMGLLSFVSCTNDEDPLLSNETGEIRFSVVDTTAVEVTTKALPSFNVNEFTVNLSRGNESIFTNRKYGDIAGETITCSASEDYVLTAESCTEAEAESANSGWGQARVYGETHFAVAANDSTEVTVSCGLANTSVEVDFSDYITSTYETYSVEVHATDASGRTFTFDERNHGFKTAYFNVGKEGREIQLTVNLPYFEKPYTKTQTLDPSASYTFTIKATGEEKDETVTLGISVNGKLLEEKILTEKINPYQ